MKARCIMSKAMNKAINRYHKKAFTTISVRFHNTNDRDVLDVLNSVGNKTDYIRQLILADMKK